MNACQADEVRRQLGAILELSRAMLAAADREEWEPLVTMETQRRRALEALFSGEGVMQVSGVPDGVRELLALDRRIIDRGEHLRQQVFQELGRIDQGRRAVRAYQAGGPG
jgi:hypothetical protein